MKRPKFDPLNLDKAIHSPIRLGVVSTLYAVGEETFTNLKKAVGATDGNLTTHLGTLVEHGIIKMKKKFVNKKPRTTLKLTPKGRKVFQHYVKTMSDMVQEFKGK